MVVPGPTERRSRCAIDASRIWNCRSRYCWTSDGRFANGWRGARDEQRSPRGNTPEIRRPQEFAPYRSTDFRLTTTDERFVWAGEPKPGMPLLRWPGGAICEPVYLYFAHSVSIGAGRSKLTCGRSVCPTRLGGVAVATRHTVGSADRSALARVAG